MGRIAITGANGQLGTAFRELLGDGAYYLELAELDLSVAEEIGPGLAALQPSGSINCAAYTAVDHAEKEPDPSRANNALAVA